ncbi:hypothetical protein K437DRAFT_256938 [Tilletiaria anomala UBC 951]|uniref:Amine oxidase n=1 Tax=Tilletiaria anomala (strain ATCC 24038 / CBS 436.72 / UBC 951) TaxID=1037660 RepID=A0A066VSI8_TILAU|nr:uncharacterized protein K437DRAFT_256938 [Tilletiaria anomala UBC 951]KDN44702.1 hypothetical protein K437DRAFT_256938 [Tilletiaria anomala UBC 951]
MGPVATTIPAATAISNEPLPVPVAKAPLASHPLDPPSAAELAAATAAVRAYLASSEHQHESVPAATLKFCSVMLKEPPKANVIEALRWPGGAATQSDGSGVPRQLEVHAIDTQPGAPGGGQAWELVVALPTAKVVSAHKLPAGVQPGLTPEELCSAEQHVRRHPAVIAAAAAVGVAPEQIYADGWSIGWDERWPGRRLQQALLFARFDGPHENLYAHPMDFFPVLDVNTGEVLAIDYTPHRILGPHKDQTTAQNGSTAPPATGSFDAPDPATRPRFPPPRAQHEYLPETVTAVNPAPAPAGTEQKQEQALHGPERLRFRADLKPLHVVQPDGVSFVRRGNLLTWQKWKLHVGFHPREGLVLSTISYRDTDDGDAERPLFYRISISEMVVPYGQPDFPHYKKFAFDVGEYGLGYLANSLDLGCDCLGSIEYMDGVVAQHDGTPLTIKNAICIHEEDAGLGWKHTDFRVGGKTAVVRNRKLIISSVYTVANYEYRVAFLLGLDGTLECEIGLTGILNVTLLAPGEKPTYATEVAPQIAAHIHQHLFSVRIDPHIDGPRNSVVEQTIEPSPHATGSAQNWAGNAFDAHRRTLRTAGEAVRDAHTDSERSWIFVNENRTHYASGKPVGYKLMTTNQPRLYAKPDSIVAKRAPFATHHFWTVPYADDRKYPAGKHCVQTLATPSDSILGWVGDGSASIENTDIVSFATVGITHVVRPEDGPVMPAEHVRLALKPTSFFRRNPMLDVPAIKDKKSVHAAASAAKCCL